MLAWDNDAFMDRLKKHLTPSATVSCRTRTQEQRSAMLDKLSALPSSSHVPSLGSGALQQK
jgi:hypothetical protein